MLSENKELFFEICLVFGIFWVIVEGFIAILFYKIYKLLKIKIEDK